MPTTFEQVMSFHPGNPDVYEEIRDNLGQLLPFVGAGLTAPVYGGWGDALKELGKSLSNAGIRRQFRSIVKECEYLDAAQFLEDHRGAINLQGDVVRHFSPSKLDDKWDRIEAGAIWLLPDLFARPILTTNFDQALERVYRTRGFTDFEALDATSESLRQQATRLLHEPCVFKLHGTVSGRMTDYDRLVFTKSQYDRHYADGSPVREALGHFARSRAALFLGCSLEKGGDETVKVLEETAGPGVSHYAIVSCKRKERDERVRELSDASIRAILYEDDKYDSVRVVLQQLLNDARRS